MYVALVVVAKFDVDYSGHTRPLKLRKVCSFLIQHNAITLEKGEKLCDSLCGFLPQQKERVSFWFHSSNM